MSRENPLPLALSVSLLLVGQALAQAQGFSPREAVRQMKLPADLQVQLVAAEPLIAQPVCIEFDDRGRLWVVQYLQYPNPAGLKRAVVDRWSRTTYDRVPAPPPHGPEGADRITILKDTDGEGEADEGHDFVSGLNLASGLAFGHGGVFVLNVPYLLFYPDRDRDDVPDGDPLVCVTGFGMEDAHSVANSLTWGPDGWLYGCQGSTVTSRIRGIEFQQGVWRYHPLTHEFELFCEGGGNSWGLDFDEEGELIYSTNFGGYRNLHGVQGAYYWKSFGKHGALHNPYAFGFFDHIPHTNFTGGHVTDGGIVYQGTNLPARFHGRYLCGDLLGHGVQWHEMNRWGSTFTSSHGGYLLEANDAWFAPTDVVLAPDGAVYVADWCDQRTAHPDPDADWDRGNGRVYRISRRSGGGPGPSTRTPELLLDLDRLTTPQLLALLSERNAWVVRTARRLLADRRDPEAILPLRSLIFETQDDQLALQAFWALYVSGGFNEAFAARALDHPSGPIRKWTVRFLGDDKRVSPFIAGRLAALAKTELDVRVCGQLASTAKRLPGEDALPIIEALLVRDENDPYLPLLLWWAVEQHAVSSLPRLESFSTEAWQSSLVREVIHERLVRRWIAEGSQATYDACARLLASAPNAAERYRLLAALEQGFHDRPVAPPGFGSGGLFAKTAVPDLDVKRRSTYVQSVTSALSTQIDSLWKDDTSDSLLIRVAARVGLSAATARARAVLADDEASLELRGEMIQMLGQLGDASDGERLLGLVGEGPEALQIAALDALPSFDIPDLGGRLLKRYPDLVDGVRRRVRQVCLSRKSWAVEILLGVDAGQLPATDFALEQLRIVALHQDKELDDLVRKHWGSIAGGTAEEKLAEMRRLNNDLNAGTGDTARGREVFTRLCGVCHVLFAEGGRVGPDLTHANRFDREFLLASVVDPSAMIRREFLAYEVETQDGRILVGVILDPSGDTLTVGVSTGEQIVVPLARVVSLRESALSIMPEGLVSSLTPQELRDLFSYIQSVPSGSSQQ